MSTERRRALRICEHLAVIRDTEAINLRLKRGQRMELHKQIGEAVAAEDSQTLKTAIQAIRRERFCASPPDDVSQQVIREFIDTSD